MRDDTDGRVIVTFRLVNVNQAVDARVVGEFNGWSTEAHPMQPDGNDFIAHIALTPGRAYRFRYLLDGERWENDWSADAYVPNEFGGDDSVVDLRDIRAPAKTPVAHETRMRKCGGANEPGVAAR